MTSLSHAEVAAEAVRRFKACAVSIGYCIDSSKSETGNMLGEDLRPLVLLMADDEEGRMEQLCTVMNTTEDPWIKYYAASFAYFDYRCEDARRVLEELTNQQGLFAPLARVMLFQGGSKPRP
jgi:hypothetical protein